MSEYTKILVVGHCCRDWPMIPFVRWGRCGDCGETPERTDKSIEQYMAEREGAA